MGSKRKTFLSEADLALCSRDVAALLRVEVHWAAEALRAAGIAKPVTLDEAKAWLESGDFPQWVLNASALQTQHQHEAKAERLTQVEVRRRQRSAFKAADRARRAQDQALCTPAAANILGLRIADVARVMRAAEVSIQITTNDARSWKVDPGSMPLWLQAVATENALQKLVAAEKLKAGDAAREQRVLAALREGKKMFGDQDLLIVEELAFRASKDLAGGARLDEFNPEELTALSVFGIAPMDHRTWSLHTGGCNGLGANCQEGEREAEIAQSMENLERQQERAQWSSDNAQAVASGRFEVGQLVSAWNGDRIGMVVKKNRVTVKVRMVGPKADGYELAERTMKPHFLKPINDDLVLTALGATVKCRSWDGRERDMVVLDVLSPLFSAEYTIQSGAKRQGWFDPTRLVAPLR